MGRSIFLFSIFLIWATMQSAEAPMAESESYSPLLLSTSFSARLVTSVNRDLESRRYEKARASLKKLWKQNDGMIAAAFYRTEIALQEAIDDGSADQYAEFVDESNEFRRLIRKAPMSASVDYLRGESERQLYTIHAARGENIRAGLAMRSGITIFENLIEHHPSFYEAYEPLGLFHVSLATMPESHRKIFDLLGIRGTVEQGISELEIAAEKSNYSASAARETLAILSRHEINDDTGVDAVMSSFRDVDRTRPMAGLILGDILLRKRRIQQHVQPVMPILPDQHQRLSDNASADFQVPYSSGG